MPRADAPRPLKVAYLCDADPRDRNMYSGGNARLFEALQREIPDLHILDPSWGLAEPLRRLLMRLPEPIVLRAKWRIHLLLARVIARHVEKQLKAQHFDAVFAAYSFHSLYQLNLPEHMIAAYTSDATPTVYKQSEIGQSFGSYMQLSRRFDHLILQAEKRVFQAADLLLWPSDWLRRGANDLYHLAPGTSLTVPWGANVPDPGMTEDVPRLERDSPVHILLVGRDWWAKGGPITAEAVRQLRAQGVDARLTVVGCNPPDLNLGDAAEVIPSLDKSIPEELARFTKLFRRSHFLMMPSFESYGFAFCEASAFGLPSLCLEVGGVPVRTGVNGVALPAGTQADGFAAQVHHFLENPSAYDDLRASTRHEYEARLNWSAWAKETAAQIRAAVEQKTGREAVSGRLRP